MPCRPASGSVALIIEGRAISYGELAAAVAQCVAGLVANEVVAGTRVAVVDGGSVLSIATVLGAARIGAAAALTNPALTPSELRGLLQSAGCAQVGAAGEAYAGRLREAGATKALTAADLLSDGQVSQPRSPRRSTAATPWSFSRAAPLGCRRRSASPMGS